MSTGKEFIKHVLAECEDKPLFTAEQLRLMDLFLSAKTVPAIFRTNGITDRILSEFIQSTNNWQEYNNKISELKGNIIDLTPIPINSEVDDFV
jgi:hypothetical protein